MSTLDELEKKLDTRQRKAVAALITGKTQAQAAAAAGVSSKTVWRWLADNTDFAAVIKAHTSLAMHAARVQLAGNLETAVSTIIEIMTAVKPAAGSGARLRAAKMVIDSALRVAEFSDILERLEVIETRLAGDGQ